ncbi:MAG: signal peptidase I [Spirulina sp. DLM2.Bin59]|nr:MAG: signal peptidase I [Spirulina sp. DLM2.Bin59]
MSKKPTNFWVESASVIGLSLFFSLVIRTFIAEARYIPSESMLPTLEVGDRLMIEKISYRFNPPQRGEIIVFYPPDTATKCDPLRPQSLPIRDAYIKRIVGLPNETVEVKEGTVYINGEPLTEDYTKAPPNYTHGPVTVAPNSYLVLGDNRNASCDSHIWGVVPRENIIGRAAVRFFPFNRLGTDI